MSEIETPNPDHPGWEGVDTLCERISAAADLLMDGLPPEVGVVLVVNQAGGPTAFGSMRIQRQEAENVILNLAEAIARQQGHQLIAVPIPRGEG